MSTPIDPGDEAELTRAFVAGVRANLDDPMAGVVAVARAVCPEHHAVYDTRTHVAVPVMALEDLLEQHDHFLYMMESPLEGEWDKTTSKQLRALLPKEETE